MTIGIYKITNLINKKSYIGQSIHIEKRWREHCSYGKKSIISQAIYQDGVENFNFEILEECSMKDLNDRETYYINFYNTINPNGYNVMEMGKSNNQIFYNYSKETFNKIIKDIKEDILSFKEIASKYNLDLSMIYYINRGDYHTIPNEKYPLRVVKDMNKKFYFCVDCGKEIRKDSIRCKECAVKNQPRKVENRPSREELKNLIRTTPFTKIGEMYGVSDNAIRKWCKAENLPFKKNEIKNYSNEEWSKI